MTIVTIPFSARKAGPYIATAGQTEFSFGFPVYAAGDLTVWRERVGVVTQLLLATHYTVSGVGEQGGGQVVLTTGSLEDDILAIDGTLNPERAATFVGGTPFKSRSIDSDLNRLAIMVQELAREVGRAVRRGPVDEQTGSLLLPRDVTQTTLLALTAAGEIVPLLPANINLGAVSPFIDGFLDDPNAATARSTLGIEVINPLDYGADPTGVADSTAAFLEAAAVYAGGNKDFSCPDGKYLLAQKITFLPNTNLQADRLPPPALRFGTNARLKATAPIAGALVEFGSANVDFSGIIRGGTVEGGIFDANNFADHGLHLPFINNALIFNCQSRNTKSHQFKIGSTSAPQRSYGAMFDQCETTRVGIQIAITSITKANPGIVTLAAPHGLSTGDKVTLSPVTGMTQLNDRTFTIVVTSPTAFSIGENTTGYGTFASGTAYSGYAPTGSCGIYFENAGDSHAINCMLTGNQISISSNDGIYDGKFTNNHAWNFLFNGEIEYAFDMAGDNALVGNQVDGPFHYGYRFSDKRNSLVGCQVNYTDGTYGGIDNYAYPMRIETGGGAAAIGCSWKAQQPTARLAADVSGDTTNFITRGCTAQNMVSPRFEEFVRQDQNGNLEANIQNLNAGSLATVTRRLATNAGTFFEVVRSVAAGASAALDWTGSGGMFFLAGNAGSSIIFQTDYASRLVIAPTTGKVTALSPIGGLGYGLGAGGTVSQVTSKSNAVTLNAVSGAITLNAANLNANTNISFTFGNSALAAGDHIVWTHRSGGTIGAYAVNAVCAAGSATVTVRNITGGNLAEAPVLGFAVVKGSDS